MKSRILQAATGLWLIGMLTWAGDIQVKWSGPAGQGNMIWYSVSTGTTNLMLTPSGVSNAVLVGTVSLPADSIDPTDIGAGNLPADVVVQALSNDTANIAVSNISAVGPTIRLTALPTSTNGLQSGQLWSSNSFLAVMP